MAENPEHKDKYLWFIALHSAVADNQELVPPDVLKRLIEQGVLQFKPFETQEKPAT
jgi:hypothetical protein